MPQHQAGNYWWGPRHPQPKWGRRSIRCHGNTPTSAPPAGPLPVAAVTTWHQSPFSHPASPRPTPRSDTHPSFEDEGSGQALPSALRSWKFHQGAEGKAPVSLRQKRLWRFCLFSLDTFMQGDAIGESHGVNIMLVCRFLRHTDSGRSFAQQWRSLVINYRAVFLLAFFSLYYLLTEEKQWYRPSHISLTQCILAYSVCISFISEYCS